MLYFHSSVQGKLEKKGEEKRERREFFSQYSFQYKLTATRECDITPLACMTKKIEALAEFYRQYGWEDAAKVLEADAAMFKKAGMPEDFPEPMLLTVEDPLSKEAFLLIKKKLVEILVSEKNVPKTKGLTIPRLAEEINKHVGQALPNSIQLEELSVKTKGNFGEFGDFAGTYVIDPILVVAFNKAVSSLSRHGIKTVGAVRENTVDKLTSLRTISIYTIKFIKKAFDRPEPPSLNLRR